MADTGWKYPSSYLVSGQAWSSPTNIYADDGNVATCSSSNVDGQTQMYLSGYSFGIPTGSTIDGIEILVDGAIYDAAGFMDVVGIQQGSTANLTNGSSMEAVVYGGSTDKWGTSFTANDINTMEVAIVHVSVGFFGGNGFSVAYDVVAVKVYYTPPVGDPGSTNTFFWSIV